MRRILILASIILILVAITVVYIISNKNDQKDREPILESQNLKLAKKYTTEKCIKDNNPKKVCDELLYFEDYNLYVEGVGTEYVYIFSNTKTVKSSILVCDAVLLGDSSIVDGGKRPVDSLDNGKAIEGDEYS